MGKNDEDGCGCDGKKRKTETEVDVQCKHGREGEGTVGGEDTKQNSVEAACQIHRHQLEVGKDAEEEDK